MDTVMLKAGGWGWLSFFMSFNVAVGIIEKRACFPAGILSLICHLEMPFLVILSFFHPHGQPISTSLAPARLGLCLASLPEVS